VTGLVGGAVIIGGAVVTSAQADVCVYVPFAGRSPLRWALVDRTAQRVFPDKKAFMTAKSSD
jgi:hypothetical protein